LIRHFSSSFFYKVCHALGQDHFDTARRNWIARRQTSAYLTPMQQLRFCYSIGLTLRSPTSRYRLGSAILLPPTNGLLTRSPPGAGRVHRPVTTTRSLPLIITLGVASTLNLQATPGETDGR
jgi:hypothetical protein